MMKVKLMIIFDLSILYKMILFLYTDHIINYAKKYRLCIQENDQLVVFSTNVICQYISKIKIVIKSTNCTKNS